MDFFSDFSMTIDGVAVRAAQTVPVRNPATGTDFASAPRAGEDNLNAAVAAAQRALPAWKTLGVEGRRQRLMAFADAIRDHVEELSSLFTREQGRPLAFARSEIQLSAAWLAGVAGQDFGPEIVEETAERRVELHHEPIGVVGAIVPWNFPVLLAMWKIAPALLAGNTMVLKPSPFTPLCALKLGELSRDLLPPGVFNVVSGDDALGPMMTAHPGIQKISFTGSTETGKKVMAAAARDLKRLTLELGGNDAAIVMPDVDVDAVAQQIFNGAFFNSAQICIATKRLYIHEDIYDALRDRLHAIARAAPIGDGAQQGVMFGPVQNEPQYRKVLALIDEARNAGLTLLQGAEAPQGGYFIPIILVDNPPETARVVEEEAFGPVLPLLKFSDVEDAIARANDSPYGLAGAVWSKDVQRAVEIAGRLETGTVWINQNLQTAPHIPFAGAKQSGFGVENGRAGLLEFTQSKTIFIPKTANC
ncbi:MAG TPA: aldehyde dehydrogenase family protein [Phenylobacterium sp.]|uniref:aldehyde dehydrogenase family protein n=1 Tax=Phenylobacterium sp. TaxID=1871053 RepID=UPI002B48F39D|nr:aldehyde dehydrogenase family protein [Phenylobacterium sp.]HKR89628.1 aldehyde dehydrogenase family protein [Phenylobacterium sp.]